LFASNRTCRNGGHRGQAREDGSAAGCAGRGGCRAHVRAVMARGTGRPLHADIRLVAQSGRALVRRAYAQAAASRGAPVNSATRNRHPGLHRDAQRKPKTLQVDQVRRRHPRRRQALLLSGRTRLRPQTLDSGDECSHEYEIVILIMQFSDSIGFAGKETVERRKYSHLSACDISLCCFIHEPDNGCRAFRKEPKCFR